MFKTVIKIANVWVDASNEVPRAQARFLANWYRTNSANVSAAKVVRVVRS